LLGRDDVVLPAIAIIALIVARARVVARVNRTVQLHHRLLREAALGFLTHEVFDKVQIFRQNGQLLRVVTEAHSNVLCRDLDLRVSDLGDEEPLRAL